MPGANDPSTASLPQQPMHRCLMPGAAGFPTVTRATNPHAFEVRQQSGRAPGGVACVRHRGLACSEAPADGSGGGGSQVGGVAFLGSSGQTVDDIYKFR